MTSRKAKAASAALVIGLASLAGLNAARHQGSHASFQSRSKVVFPTDLTYSNKECPAYHGLGFACWAPIARTIYYAGKPDYSTYLHESCHAWQTDHASDADGKQQIKAILGYPARERFDWNIGEAARDHTRTPPIEAFADGCEQCARGVWNPNLGYGRYLSKSRLRGLCRFIASRA